MQIKFKKLHPSAVIPNYAHPGEDAGLDMTCTEVYSTPDFISYKTGIAMEIPQGYVGLLFPRSSNCKKDLLLSNSVGVIDSGYRGEIEFRYKLVFDPTEEKNECYLGKRYFEGDKIGQLIIMPYPNIEPIEVNELSDSIRGVNGYGSTNK